MTWRVVRSTCLKALIIFPLVVCGICGRAEAGDQAVIEINLDPERAFDYEGAQYKVDLGRGFALVRDGNDRKGWGDALFAFQGRSNDTVEAPLSFLAFGEMDDTWFKAADIIAGNDYYDRMETRRVSEKMTLILFWSQGGAHFMDLGVYRVGDTGLEKVFEAGSACGVETSDAGGGLRIKIYRDKLDVPDWSFADETDRWEIWDWNGTEFDYNEKESTVKPERETQVNE